MQTSREHFSLCGAVARAPEATHKYARATVAPSPTSQCTSASRAFHARAPGCWHGTLRWRSLCNGVRAGGSAATSGRTLASSTQMNTIPSAAADRPRPSTSIMDRQLLARHARAAWPQRPQDARQQASNSASCRSRHGAHEMVRDQRSALKWRGTASARAWTASMSAAGSARVCARCEPACS